MTAWRPADVARLVVLGAIWGASFVFVRVLVEPLGPAAVACGRVLIAGLALVGWATITRVDPGLRAHWRAYLFVGVLNSGLPFLLYGYAALRLPASYLSVLNATTPMFASLLAPFWLAERLTGLTIAGLLLGLAGVALVSGSGPVTPDASFAVAVVAAVAAAACYALAGIWLKRRGTQLRPLALAGWSQMFAGFALLPVALANPPQGPFTASVAANLLALALVCSAVAYLLYYRLIRDVGPTSATTVTFLIPVFGMAWGALFLGEVITFSMVLGLALVVAGILMVFGASRMRAAGTAPRA